MLKADEISRLLNDGQKRGKINALRITPMPDPTTLEKSGSASIDLRLGRWFLILRASRMPFIDIKTRGEAKPQPVYHFTKTHFISFGQKYYLHPRHFALATTLEWICLPTFLGGYVIGKSSWGRRGLIIATAAGVHPGFKGCLTLELTNVGEIPIAITPGIEICQLFLHRIKNADLQRDRTQFFGMRKPIPGEIELDDFALKLANIPYSKPKD